MTLPSNLARNERRFLKALQEANRWLSRTELAQELGKKQAGLHDGRALQNLVDMGLVNVRRRYAHQIGQPSYEYKVKL